MIDVRGAVRAVVAAAVGLLVLAGCVRVDGELTVNGTADESPDTVSGTMLVAVSDEWAIAQGSDPADLAAAIEEELAAQPDAGVTGEPYAQDGYTGTTLTFTDLPIERLTQATDGAISITRDGDRYEVRGDVSVLDSGDQEVPWSVALSVTLPEEVTEHNGTLDGRTVTWSIDPSSSDTTMLAIADVGPLPWYAHVPVWLWVVTGLAGVGAALALVLSRRERREGVATAVAGVRARQARARGASTTKLDDMIGPKRERQVEGGRTGAKPRGAARRGKR